MKKKKVLIVGLGLMGASLGLSLGKKYEVWGLSRDKKKLRTAKNTKIIFKGINAFSDIPHDVELICVCVPVSKIVETVSRIDKAVSRRVLVTDVGSTKKSIVDKIKKAKLKKVNFVGSHPMAGGHRSGLSSAQARLYEKSLVFVTRDHGTLKDIKKVSLFWKKAGAARVSVVSSKDHDKIVGDISHLPHVMASLLIESIPSKNIQFGGAGFKDVTRVAQGDAGLWVDIVSSNPFLLSSLKEYRKTLDHFIKLSKGKKWSSVKKLLSSAEKKRKKLNS